MLHRNVAAVDFKGCRGKGCVGRAKDSRPNKPLEAVCCVSGRNFRKFAKWQVITIRRVKKICLHRVWKAPRFGHISRDLAGVALISCTSTNGSLSVPIFLFYFCMDLLVSPRISVSMTTFR
ncbi:unnamed protein product, partial [Ixodes pacificus]